MTRSRPPTLGARRNLDRRAHADHVRLPRDLTVEPPFHYVITDSPPGRHSPPANSCCAAPGAALAEARRTARIGKGEGVVGRTAVTLGPAQVPDITVAGAYEGRLREGLIAAGVPAVRAVPPDRLPRRDPKRARRLPARDHEAAPNVRHSVDTRDSERAPLPRDPGQEPSARGRQPAQVRVLSEHVPRATDTPQRDHRLLRGINRPHVWRAEREAGGVSEGYLRVGHASSR